MSAGPQVRRSDKLMTQTSVEELLSRAYSGRLATVGPDGWPYVCPLLYIWLDGKIWVHTTSAIGHLRNNVMFQPKVCFELDEPGQVFLYGRSECDTSLEYRSVVVFGQISILEDDAQKTAFFDVLMQKYTPQDIGRPRGVYPRLNQVTVYAITVERRTGKETILPAVESQWPALANKATRHAGA